MVSRLERNRRGCRYTFGQLDSGVVGDHYKLCWGHDSNEPLRVQVDSSLTLSGPSETQFECILGVRCILTVDGYGFSAQDAVALVTGTSCGDPDGSRTTALIKEPMFARPVKKHRKSSSCVLCSCHHIAPPSVRFQYRRR